MPLPTAWSPWNLAQPSHVVKKNIDRLQRTILLTSCDRSMSPAGRGGQREREDADHTEQDACVLPRHGFRGRACASPESSLTRPRSVPPAGRGLTDRAVAMIRSPPPRFPGGRGAYQQDGPSGNRCVRGKVLRRLRPCLGERTAQDGRNRHRPGRSDISGRPSGIGRRCVPCKARLVPAYANLRIPRIVLQPRET